MCVCGAAGGVRGGNRRKTRPSVVPPRPGMAPALQPTCTVYPGARPGCPGPAGDHKHKAEGAPPEP